MTKKNEPYNHGNKIRWKNHILMHDFKIKYRDSHVGHDDLLHNAMTRFDWNHSEDDLLRFLYRSEERGMKRALTAKSAAPEQHEETAGHRVKTPGAAEPLRYRRDEQTRGDLRFFVTAEADR